MSILVPLSLALLTAAPPSSSEVLAEAKQHLAKGNLDGVFFALDGKSFEPADHEAVADLLAAAGQKSLAAKDDVFALQFAQMALRLKPEHPRVLEVAARAQLAQKQFSGAESLADRWIAATDSPEAILFRSDLALSQGDWERALALSASATDRTLTAEQRKQAQRITTAATRELASEAAARRELEQLDRELARAQDQAAQEERSTRFVSATKPSGEVIVYGFKGCGFCTKVMTWLKAHRIAYAYKDILEDKEANAEMWKKKNARGIKSGGVPVTDIEGTLIQGAKMEEIEKAARDAGLLR